MKYVIITGGVVSGLGKGICSSSIGVLLQKCGLSVTTIKIDPYLNVDAGTMSPYEHGEVFVLDDGGESDLDLGNYERFLDIKLTRDHNITTGKIYNRVIQRERKGDYLGKTVQVVPHITDEIQNWIARVSALPVSKSGKVPDVCMIEVGGTVGDIEGMIFLEALRQFRFRVGGDNFCHAHVSLVPVVGAVGVQKSKPTQHGVRELRAAGLNPDLIICRSTKPVVREIISKVSLFCMVPSTHVISVHDVSTIYKVPLLLLKQHVPSLVMGCLKINKMPPEDLPKWRELARRVHSPKTEVRIAIVGKYTGLSDSYLSVTKALFHSCLACNLKLNIQWIESSFLEELEEKSEQKPYEDAWKTLKNAHGILIPGGFGDRGIQGKISAVKYARTNNVPFLGVCLGMQLAVVEYCRSILGWADANSAEFNPDTKYPVVIAMPEISKTHKGGTMRLGLRRSIIKEGTIASKLYKGAKFVDERHRHRYEVNPKMIADIEKAGLIFSAHDIKKERMEMIELKDHKFFVGCQFHPEFKSRPFYAAPLFKGFIQASDPTVHKKKKT